MTDVVNSVLYAVEDALSIFKRMNKRQFLFQLLNFGLVIQSAYMLWKGLGVAVNTESPIVVVLSESMSPAFERGDILFLTMFKSQPIVTGDICVFKLKGRDIPIVHRVIKVHEKYFLPKSLIFSNQGKLKILTKGDHNEVHDRGLYNRGQRWLDEEDLVGRVKGYVPYLGMVTIWMNDYPQLKYAVLAILAFFVLSSRD